MRVLETKYLFTVSKSPLFKQVNGIINYDNHNNAQKELKANALVQTFQFGVIKEVHAQHSKQGKLSLTMFEQASLPDVVTKIFVNDDADSVQKVSEILRELIEGAQ